MIVNLYELRGYRAKMVALIVNFGVDMQMQFRVLRITSNALNNNWKKQGTGKPIAMFCSIVVGSGAFLGQGSLLPPVAIQLSVRS